MKHLNCDFEWCFVCRPLTFFYFIHFSADKYYALISTNQSTVGWRNVVFHLTSQRIRRTTESWYLICVHLQGIETTTNETNVKRLELNKDKRLRHSGVRFLFVFFSFFSIKKHDFGICFFFLSWRCHISVVAIIRVKWTNAKGNRRNFVFVCLVQRGDFISFAASAFFIQFLCIRLCRITRFLFASTFYLLVWRSRQTQKKREKRRRTDLKNNTVKHLTNNFVRVWRMFDNCKRNTIKSSEKRLN